MLAPFLTLSFSSCPHHPLLTQACTRGSFSIPLLLLPTAMDCSSNFLVSLPPHPLSMFLLLPVIVFYSIHSLCSLSCWFIFLPSSLSPCPTCTTSLSQSQPCLHFFIRQLPSGQTPAPLFFSSRTLACPGKYSADTVK